MDLLLNSSRWPVIGVVEVRACPHNSDIPLLLSDRTVLVGCPARHNEAKIFCLRAGTNGGNCPFVQNGSILFYGR